MKIIDRIALVLIIIGGLHLLLVAFDVNVFTIVFGEESTVTDVIYILIGLSALWSIKYFNYTPKGGSRLKGR